MRFLTCVFLATGLVFAGCSQDDEVTTPTGGGNGGGGGNGAGNGGGSGSSLTANSTLQFSLIHPITGEVRTLLSTNPNVTHYGEMGVEGVGTSNSSYHFGGVDFWHNSDEYATAERFAVIFGWRTYNTDVVMDDDVWFSQFLTIGSIPYATEQDVFINDPILRVRMFYEDFEGNLFMSVTGENSASSFDVLDIDFVPTTSTVPAHLKFYATFNCETDTGPLQGHVVGRLAY